MLDNTPSATVKKERYGNVAGVRLVHLPNQMRQEWVFVPFNQSLLISLVTFSLAR